MVKLKGKKGISLITLVITIIVVIILAGVIILNMQQNNPIKQAEKAKLYQDVDNFKSELEIYKQDVYANKLGKFNSDTLQADNLSLRQAGQVINGENIYSVIPSLEDSGYQDTDFAVVDGKLVYRGENEDYQDWLEGTGKVIIDKGSITVLIAIKQKIPVKAGSSVEYDINISSDQGLKQVDQASILSKIFVVDNTQKELSTQPNKQITGFSYAENSLSMQIIIDTTSIQDGEYTIKLNQGMIENSANKQSDEIIDTKDMFEIDSTAPEAPIFELSTTSPTNQDVTVTITYPSDAAVKQYKIESQSWTDYTAPFTVSDNCTVYAITKDSAGNQSSESSINITNIDSTAPEAPTFALSTTNPTNQDVTVTITYPSDAAVKEYRIDSGSWTDYTVPFTVSSNCTIYAITKDSAENQSSESSINITNIDKQAPEAPTFELSTTDWTNQDVTVTITYPSDAAVKQYRIGSGSWTDYTAPFTVSDNGTVYAITKDSAGNQSSESSINITNIDKQAPSAPTVNLNGYTSGIWTNQNVKIDLNSTDNASGIQKYQYSYDGVNWTDISSSYTISSDYYYYITYRSIDEAENISLNAQTNIIQIDKTGPTYSSYEIKNISSSGYDVYVYGVTDNYSGINRVQFPTWTDYNGQDDLVSEWWSNSTMTGQNQGNSTWHFRVNSSAHNNEVGQYQTHVYIYDALGNYISFATSGANVQSRVGEQYSFGGKSWIIANIDSNGHAILLYNGSDLGTFQFSTNTGTTDNRWYDSNIRTYLNSTFYNSISSQDIGRIIAVLNNGERFSSDFGGDGSEIQKSSTNNVWLLSSSQIYGSLNPNANGLGTSPYTINGDSFNCIDVQGGAQLQLFIGKTPAQIASIFGGIETWCRSPLFDAYTYNTFVNTAGYLSWDSARTTRHIRPAIMINAL